MLSISSVYNSRGTENAYLTGDLNGLAGAWACSACAFRERGAAMRGIFAVYFSLVVEKDWCRKVVYKCNAMRCAGRGVVVAPIGAYRDSVACKQTRLST